MRDYINADSLAFISIDGLYRALGEARDSAQPQRCDACFTGDYPTSLTDAEERGSVAGLALVVPWGVFVVSLFAPAPARWSTRVRFGLTAATVAIAGMAAAVATRPRAQAVAVAIVARSIRARGRYAPHALTPSDASLTNQFS